MQLRGPFWGVYRSVYKLLVAFLQIPPHHGRFSFTRRLAI